MGAPRGIAVNVLPPFGSVAPAQPQQQAAEPTAPVPVAAVQRPAGLEQGPFGTEQFKAPAGAIAALMAHQTQEQKAAAANPMTQALDPSVARATRQPSMLQPPAQRYTRPGARQLQREAARQARLAVGLGAGWRGAQGAWHNRRPRQGKAKTGKPE